MNLTPAMLTALIGAVAVLSPKSLCADDEFGSQTPYYEDDAWYDISEWFDGNDYNPTDEALGRWDDERLQLSNAVSSTDVDNDDNSTTDYGFRKGNESDWFYDHYDDGYADWTSERHTVYFDVDDDGLYDTYATYWDADSDGVYEHFMYFTLNNRSASGNTSAKQLAQEQQKEYKSLETEIMGTVANKKTAEVRNRKHLVVQLNGTDGQLSIVDLGQVQDERDVPDGETLSATGHVVSVGEKKVLVASEASAKDESIEINRKGTQFRGAVEKIFLLPIRGNERTLVKLRTDDGKSMLVDLGAARKSGISVYDGEKIGVRGVPARVNDRVVLMANELEQRGKILKIDGEVSAY